MIFSDFCHFRLNRSESNRIFFTFLSVLVCVDDRERNFGDFLRIRPFSEKNVNVRRQKMKVGGEGGVVKNRRNFFSDRLQTPKGRGIWKKSRLTWSGLAENGYVRNRKKTVNVRKMALIREKLKSFFSRSSNDAGRNRNVKKIRFDSERFGRK